MKQLTIKKPVEIKGVALHSGKEITMKLIPLEANQGIIYKRTDLAENNIIEAKPNNVHFTTLCTQIDNGHGAVVSTIEHLMSALYHLGIDNLMIEVNGSELPVLDGSANVFVKKIAKAGIKQLDADKKFLKILKPLEIKSDKWSVSIKPSEQFVIDMIIDFAHPTIGRQRYKYVEGKTNYLRAISRARTFGFLKDVEFLRSQGLGRGASVENTVVLDETSLYKDCKLRYKNEFVRHKILDMCGDLYVAGFRIQGEIFAEKPGHQANNLLLREIFSDPSNYEITTESNKNILIKYENRVTAGVLNY
ncbi:UDP-3-O-acyl-N-acetylglucosamine deacetylase [Rickettsiales bacterium LUAb2]